MTLQERKQRVAMIDECLTEAVRGLAVGVEKQLTGDKVRTIRNLLCETQRELRTCFPRIFGEGRAV